MSVAARNPRYDRDVFLNCPFDEQYWPFLEAIYFAVASCGLRIRCALEKSDSGEIRLSKIQELIRDCRYGIHDISRTELNEHQLPRFNMPFEMGLFLGAKAYGGPSQRDKVCLILDVDRYRYQKFLSDIAGQDPSDYDVAKPHELVGVIRNWLKSHTSTSLLGPQALTARFLRFQSDMPTICEAVELQRDKLTFTDLGDVIAQWLQLNP